MNMGAVGVIVACGAVGWHLTHPVTITEPYILRVDSTTGAVDVISTVKDQEISQSVAVDRYWVAEFVRSYESYSYQSIQYSYDRTLSMASPTVAKQYEKTLRVRLLVKNILVKLAHVKLMLSLY